MLQDSDEVLEEAGETPHELEAIPLSGTHTGSWLLPAVELSKSIVRTHGLGSDPECEGLPVVVESSTIREALQILKKQQQSVEKHRLQGSTDLGPALADY